MWHRGLSYWKTSFPVGKTNDYHKHGFQRRTWDVSHSIIPPPSAYLWSTVHWGCNRPPGIRRTMAHKWWMTNRDSFDQVSVFPPINSTVTMFSCVACRHISWLRLVNRGTWMGRPLHSHIPKSIRWTMCFERILPGSALCLTVNWATIWRQFCFAKRDNLWRLFSLIMRECPTPWRLHWFPCDSFTLNKY